MIFQMMPIAMAVLHNERFAREVAGLAPSRPGGPVMPDGMLHGLPAAGLAGRHDGQLPADTVRPRPRPVSPQFGG